MALKVLMLPQLKSFRNDESGIKRVVEAYHDYSKETDVEYVDDGASYDLVVSHAGTKAEADVAINHGLYWTADYEADGWEWDLNSQVIKALRMAKEITVPSNWVAEVFKREMRVNPHIIGHGIDFNLWQDKSEHYPFVLWNKNRISDVCSPVPVMILAKKYTNIRFFTTFYPQHEDVPSNVRVSGKLNHSDMKSVIKSALVYLSTTKETFGIGVLEAMASGLPILAFAWGGNLDLVQHGVNGYLAAINNYEDLSNGLEYCMKNAQVLGENSRELAKKWGWREACVKLRNVYDLALSKKYKLPLTIPEREYKQ